MEADAAAALWLLLNGRELACAAAGAAADACAARKKCEASSGGELEAEEAFLSARRRPDSVRPCIVASDVSAADRSLISSQRRALVAIKWVHSNYPHINAESSQHPS